jgi:hypothetical protein
MRQAKEPTTDLWLSFIHVTYKTRLKNLEKDKHSSLFCHAVNNGGRSFTKFAPECVSVSPGSRVIKFFTAVIYVCL